MKQGWYCQICYSDDPSDYDIIMLCAGCLDKRPDRPKIKGPVTKCPSYCLCCRRLIGSLQ